jgi:hypothetical protein
MNVSIWKANLQLATRGFVTAPGSHQKRTTVQHVVYVDLNLTIIVHG